MTAKWLQTILLFGMATAAFGQKSSPPDVPDKLKVPSGEQLLLQAHATGSQIYVCQQGADGKSAWTLTAPDAELHDPSGEVIGRHYAGPTWKYKDGSEVTGKAVARVDSPDSDSIPWLLVTATSHSGNGRIQPCHQRPAHSHKRRPGARGDRVHFFDFESGEKKRVRG